MLADVYLHTGQPIAPHDALGSWSLDPLAWVGMAAVVWLYGRGHRHQDRRWFWFGMLAIFLALISPLEAMSGSLASAHMAQHLLLILVAAPAFVRGGVGAAVYAGWPVSLRRKFGASRRRLGLNPARVRRLASPVLSLLAHAGILLFWHAAGPYQAALISTPVHYLEHTTLVGSAVWFWLSVFSDRHPHSGGVGVLGVFGLALQSVFLALLMTFAERPWYSMYEQTTPLWGLTALADQHLAGVIMWVPAGLVYAGIGLTQLARWLRAIEERSVLRQKRPENFEIPSRHGSAAEPLLDSSSRRDGVDLPEAGDR
ncbi:hypothetical protein BH18ACT5_BH18ACT5_02690 [soil metagenome]